MRFYLGIFAFLCFLLILLPGLLVLMLKMVERGELPPAKEFPIAVHRHDLEGIVELDMEEYLKGVVAAEMPALFEKEALKAQAVVARTYTVKRLKVMGGSGSARHPGADICTDPSHDQAWLSQEALRLRWGLEGYTTNWSRIDRAVEETRGLILTYEGSPIDAVYHSTSGGRTENSEDVWKFAFPYLKGVVSPWEAHSPYYVNRREISLNELAAAVARAGISKVKSIPDLAAGVSVVESTVSGRAKLIRVGPQVLKGEEFRRLLGLNSSWFSWKTDGQVITVTTRGKGHGVGLSQYGADGMARKGYQYAEILSHYYQGTKLQGMPPPPGAPVAFNQAATISQNSPPAKRPSTTINHPEQNREDPAGKP
ncbi:MAG: stage II sporulation protein D [Firmicutes bacterium]|nr:stage II sporulation protein D [Bacillota bacterium]